MWVGASNVGGSKMWEQDVGRSKMWVGARCGSKIWEQDVGVRYGWEQDVGGSKMWEQVIGGSKLWVGVSMIFDHSMLGLLTTLVDGLEHAF